MQVQVQHEVVLGVHLRRRHLPQRLQLAMMECHHRTLLPCSLQLVTVAAAAMRLPMGTVDLLAAAVVLVVHQTVADTVATCRLQRGTATSTGM